MGVKETMAFLGDAGSVCPDLMKKLAQQGYRLLFISKDATQMRELSEEFTGSNWEVEIQECAKEGCWEADIIAFVDPQGIDTEVVRRVKDVATQKIVLCIETTESPESCFSQTHLKDLQSDFPFSKVVYIKVDTQRMKVRIHGKHPEAREIISGIFEATGHEVESTTNSN